MKKNTDIEALRSVAILLTLVMHLGTLLPYGSQNLIWLAQYLDMTVGVDLFFVVSGFVITISLRKTQDESQVSVLRMMLAFWLKRIFRLLPSAFFWLILLMGYFSLQGNLLPLLIPIIASMLNIMNLYTAYCVVNSDDSILCGIYYIHGHYWSLSLEEQFYFIYPFLFFLFNRRLFILLLFVLIVGQLFWTRPLLSYGWFFRTDGLCWGVLLGMLYRSEIYQKFNPRLMTYKWFSSAVLITLCLVLTFAARQVVGFGDATKPYGVGLVAFIGAILVWLSSYNRDYFVVTEFVKKIVIYLGSRSYSLYISHLILFSLIRSHYDFFVFQKISEDIQITNVYILCLGLTVTFLASELTYQFIEVPSKYRGRLRATKLLKI
jgi:peptidoglycan/LPS O-acetylase OafA/YrhL